MHRKIILLAVMAVGALMLGSTVSAQPDPNCVPPGNNDSGGYHCVHTFAEVGGTGNPPVVLNAWVLPDMDQNAPGMQYTDGKLGAVNAEGNDLPDQGGKFGHLHDDAAAPRKYPEQVVVTPNIDDKPQKREVEIFAVVMDPNGIQDILAVRAEVRLPDGTKKGVAFDLTRHVNIDGTPNCDAIADPLDPHSPRHAAENTGQLPHGKIIPHDCVKGLTALYSGTFLLNNDQPDGKYSIIVRATDGKGTGPDTKVGMTVPNVIAIKIDFTSVDYGLISPGVRKVVGGDKLFGNGIPTIVNTGNHPACLSVHFSTMVGKLRQDVISNFDAALWVNQVSESIKFAASIPQQFSTPLESKVPVQIDFSIDPPIPLDTDLYQGTVDLSIKKPVPPTPPATGTGCGGE